MHRPLVHDDERVACVVGCMLLVELYQAGQLQIGRDGKIYPTRGASNEDQTLNAVLADLQAQRYSELAATWLNYLVRRDECATTLVWQRLVRGGDALAEKSGWRRRRSRYVLTELRATIWARRYIEEHVTDNIEEIPETAVVLWRGLKELRLDAALEIAPDIERRLDRTPLPADLAPLFAALTHVLARLATPL
ncbi:GPP34 family phosphoprotein [Amycolatopsis sp. CM201R]|nr:MULTISPECIES: GPP34 family phosphoprotein [unclassified Amycolatopsis]MDS0140565.1 GPP34 family phosphoprotein [Amycolatopsis sp. 505]MDS0149215.1 GPP34 family phosphoprotein [Amycolatopsis sp. CM201R]